MLPYRSASLNHAALAKKHRKQGFKALRAQFLEQEKLRTQQKCASRRKLQRLIQALKISKHTMVYRSISMPSTVGNFSTLLWTNLRRRNGRHLEKEQKIQTKDKNWENLILSIWTIDCKRRLPDEIEVKEYTMAVALAWGKVRKWIKTNKLKKHGPFRLTLAVSLAQSVNHEDVAKKVYWQKKAYSLVNLIN